MKCDCCNGGTCSACLYYKSILKIINSINFLTIVDPATHVRKQTNTTFDITPEECSILERMKTSQNDTEYKEYISNPTHYIKINNKTVAHINCPHCNNKLNISITPVNKANDCCGQLTINKVHDDRCMYYGGYFY
jgi:hypothetical protein